MPIGAQVGLGPGHTVLDGDPAQTFSAIHNDSWRPPCAVAAVSRFRRRDI